MGHMQAGEPGEEAQNGDPEQHRCPLFVTWVLGFIGLQSLCPIFGMLANSSYKPGTSSLTPDVPGRREPALAADFKTNFPICATLHTGGEKLPLCSDPKNEFL